MAADDLTRSVSQMFVEMGPEDGQKFARRALVKFVTQVLSGVHWASGMNISTFSDGKRPVLAQASAIVFATIQVGTSRL